MAKQVQAPLTIIRRKQVEARTGLARSTIYDRIKSGTFPAPISLGAKAVGWVESEIDHWLMDRIESRINAAGVAK
jgi:prophage regulatory protein